MPRKAAAEKGQVGATPTGASVLGDASVPPPPPAEQAPPASAERPEPAVAPAVPVEAAPDYKGLYEQANDRWLRARAELDNYRKRVQREFGEIRCQAILQTAGEFLGVHDHLSLALNHAQSAAQAVPLRQGLELISAEFARALASLGVTRIETVGKPFDPACQEAISQEASEEVPAGVVLREWKAGFALGGRLLRPAAVTVSSGPAAPVPPEAPAGQPAETVDGKR